MKKLLLRGVMLFAAFAGNYLHAQNVQQPVFEPVKTKKFELAPYVPTKAFLAKNPNFLIDGSYQLDPSLIPNFYDKKVQSKLSEQFQSPDYLAAVNHAKLTDKMVDSLFNVSSANVPMTVYTANHPANIKLSGTIHFYSPLRGAFKQFDIYFPFDKKHTDQNWKDKYVAITKEALQNMNISNYNIDDYLSSNGSDKVYLIPLNLTGQGVSINTVKNMNPEDLILKFENVQMVALSSKLIGDDFPGYAVFSLSIQDALGNTLTQYKQGILFQSNFSGIVEEYISAFSVKCLYPTALKCLIAQFSNDTRFLDSLQQYQAGIIKLQKDNPYYAEYFKNKLLIGACDTKIAMDKSWLNEINKELKDLGASTLEGYGVLNVHSGNLGTDVAANAIVNAPAAIFNIMTQNSNKKAIQADRDSGNSLIADIKTTQTKRDSVINNASPVVRTKLAEDGYTVSNDNGAEIEGLNNTFQNNYSNAQNNLEHPQYTQSLAEAMNNANAFWNNPAQSLSQAATAGASGNATTTDISDDCQKQAYNAWYQKTSYKKCNGSLPTNSRQADCEDAKADLGELLLQYCKDKLGPNDVKAIQAGINTARSTANTLRQANTFRWSN